MITASAMVGCDCSTACQSVFDRFSRSLMQLRAICKIILVLEHNTAVPFTSFDLLNGCSGEPRADSTLLLAASHRCAECHLRDSVAPLDGTPTFPMQYRRSSDGLAFRPLIFGFQHMLLKSTLRINCERAMIKKFL